MSSPSGSRIKSALEHGDDLRLEFQSTARNWWEECCRHLRPHLGRDYRFEPEEPKVRKTAVDCTFRYGPIHFQHDPSVVVQVSLSLTPKPGVFIDLVVSGAIAGEMAPDIAAKKIIDAMESAAKRRHFEDSEGIRFRTAQTQTVY